MTSQNEIILYQHDSGSTHIDVRIEDETVWLTQQQIIDLFGSCKANISDHLKHIYESGELEEPATIQNFRTVRKEGGANGDCINSLLHSWWHLIITFICKVK